MRVLFASNQAAAVMRGGVLTQALQTKQALEKLGVEIVLYDAWHEFQPDDFDLVHIFTANMATYHLARAFKSHSMPIVISPVFFTRRSPGVARSVVSADKFTSRFMRGFWTDYGIIEEMCHWAEALLPNTTDEAKLFEEAFRIPAQKITVVPNGVEERFAHAKPDLFEKEYGIKNFILNVGHIGPGRKNVMRLIEALEQIDHDAAIIGRIEDTPEGRACLERARHNRRLLVVDTLPHDSMLLASAYSACDVFVLPSQFETPGISALEAALAGAKIVITPFGGTKDYFKDNAVYIDPTSADDIAEGIKSALAKGKDTELRDRIKNEFIWDKVGEKTKQVYERVLARI